MHIRSITPKKILTKQKGGFLTEGEYPFTHTLSWAVGCGFGNIYCGKYCYAQTFPNWEYNRQADEAWGDAVILKDNAAELLANELANADNRHNMRIFMSSVTDPYQPIEKRHRITRHCLEVFAQYDDLDLLVIQTRSLLVTDDLALIASIPYAFISMTIETDRGDLAYGPNQKFIEQRLAAVKQAVAANIPVQITVSPCLPYSDQFAQLLIGTGVDRIVVDTFMDGDGDQGKRTATTEFADEADYNWKDNDPARQLHDQLKAASIKVSWSSAGFGGIPPRHLR